jgi:hypothetical protein
MNIQRHQKGDARAMKTQTEATGWKLGLLVGFLLAVVAVVGMVGTGSGFFGYLALLAAAGLLVSSVGAWTTSG